MSSFQRFCLENLHSKRKKFRLLVPHLVIAHSDSFRINSIKVSCQWWVKALVIHVHNKVPVGKVEMSNSDYIWKIFLLDAYGPCDAVENKEKRRKETFKMNINSLCRWCGIELMKELGKKEHPRRTCWFIGNINTVWPQHIASNHSKGNNSQRSYSEIDRQ